jgi:TolB-like protein/DNA-binding winged helix-turn-helix (wHTH) protein/tetratricopeptide (TPR) repeat protein
MTRLLKPSYSFGLFVLDSAEGRLVRGGEPISLTPKAIETLLVLVENAGHLTEKEELLRRVWPDTFVEEATVAKNISLLRKALGDSTESEEYIQTVPKRGYRFVARVERGNPPSDVVSTVPQAPAGPSFRVLLIGLSATLLVSAFLFHSFRAVPASTLGSQEHVKVVVLPFEDLSAGAVGEYFADGLTEEMIRQLARVNPDRMAVIARTSSMHFKGSQKTVAQIGKELDVEYLIEGSLRHDGERLRISVRLVQVKDQVHLWAQNYERDLRDVLAVQDDVARAVAGEIGVRLEPPATPGDRAAKLHTVAPEVNELYLKGRYFWNKRTEAGYVKAIQYFDEAIQLDPQYAAAYAGLADSYALLGSMANSTLPRIEAMPRARAFAERALALDESLAEARTSLAFVKMHFEQDWDAAEREYRRAIASNPSYVTAHHWYAYCLIAQARVDEALREIRRAQELDPLSLIINTDVAEMLYFARRHDEAIQQARKTLEMDPSFALAQRVLGLAYEEKGMYPESIAALQKLVEISERADYALAALGRSYALSGNRAEAEKLLEELLALKTQDSGVFLGPAIVYAALGNKDQALLWLEKLYQRRAGIILIKVEPYFDVLRAEPRFQALERRMALASN